LNSGDHPADILAAAKAFQRRGDLAEAEAAYGHVLTLDPENAEALNNLGNLLRALKRPAEAVTRLRQALAARPEHPAILSNLGLALGDLRRFAEAAECHRRAVAIDPKLAAGHNNLGLALKELGLFAEAEESYRRALALNPDFAETLNNLGNVLRTQGRLEEAVAAYRHAVAIKPDYADAHNNLGNALRDGQHYEQAIQSYRRALDLAPGLAKAHCNFGKLLQEIGYTAAAHGAFAQAIDCDATLVEAYFNLVDTAAGLPENRHIAQLEALALKGDALSIEDRMALRFTLARAYERLERYDESFEELSEAKRLRRGQIEFEGSAERERIDELKRVFTRQLVASKSNSGSPSELPIFVLGFPRSGTTLTEQILASHPAVYGAGELGILARIANGLHSSAHPDPGFPACLPMLPPAELRRAGEDYVRQLQAHAPAATRITDKLPENYHFPGLIHLILPKAKILHVMRDPLDTCLSCFQEKFHAGIAYANELHELGDYYRCYAALMDHWRLVLPAGSMLEVRYEDLVEDLEGEARRMLDYCGLPWDDRCLYFHKTERPVKTASLVQVRRPLYRSSVGRWRRYERHLGPLMEALGPVALADRARQRR
jgi:tetratricopeptide (TPR) repeat protein